MNTASKIILAGALVFSLVAPVMAQEERTLNERNVYLFMNGKMIESHVSTDATSAMIMRHFKPLRNGTMIYVNGGKLYIGQDSRMHGGQMMSTMIFGRELGAGSQR